MACKDGNHCGFVTADYDLGREGAVLRLGTGPFGQVRAQSSKGGGTASSHYRSHLNANSYLFETPYPQTVPRSTNVMKPVIFLSLEGCMPPITLALPISALPH